MAFDARSACGLSGLSKHDNRECNFFKLKVALGLLPKSANAKVPLIGKVGAEFGPKAAVYGELALTGDGLVYDYGVEGGFEANLTLGRKKFGVGCSANPGNGDFGCGEAMGSKGGDDGGFSVSSHGNVTIGMGTPLGKVSGTVGTVDIATAWLRRQLNTFSSIYREARESWRQLQFVTSPVR